MKTKTVKEFKMHKFLVCAYKSQDFAQSQKICAGSHDRETVTFRNSACYLKAQYSLRKLTGLKGILVFIRSLQYISIYKDVFKV